MRIGLVGCGYVGDMYMKSLKNYPKLELAAVTDLDHERAEQFGTFYSVKTSPSLDALLSEPGIELIVNLSASDQHFEISKKCLESGKHVYSDKPMTTNFEDAKKLTELAEQKGLYLSSAPCGILGETAQTLWKALRGGAIGTPRLVYAEYEDGPLHLQNPHTWRGASGSLYPYPDFFKVGFPIVHAAYHLTWLAAFFGPAQTITTYSNCFWPDKTIEPEKPLHVSGPDMAVAAITFESGVAARYTCGLLGPHNHSLRIIGEKGILKVEEIQNYCAPVYVDKYSRLKFRVQRYPISERYPFVKAWFDPNYKVYPPVKKFNWKKKNARHHQDYARGIAEMANAIFEQRPSRLPADYCLHITELTLALQNASTGTYKMTTTFNPLQPLDDKALKEITSINW